MKLKAGTGRIDISPPEGVQLFGYPGVQRVATGVHDPLWVSALALSDGKRTCLLAALDLLFLDPPTSRAIRHRVAEAISTNERLVFIGCTHTHSGPVTSKLVGWLGDIAMPDPDPLYLELVSDAVVEAARMAVSEMIEAALAWTATRVEGVGCNRHDPRGRTDPEVGVLSVRTGGGKLLGVVAVYGMHPTVLHEDSTLISSDFPHYARLEILERFGGEVVVLHFTGPAGDQSPRYHVQAQTFAEAERLGRRLGRAEADAVAVIDAGTYRGEVDFEGAIETFEPVRRRLPDRRCAEELLNDYKRKWEQLQREGAERARVRTAECAVFGAEAAVNLAKALECGLLEEVLKQYEPFEVQALRIGDSFLVGTPAELFCDYGLKIKSFRRGKIFVASLVNGHMQGYITTQEAAEMGGYEAAGAVFDWRTGEEIVAGAERALRSLGLGPLHVLEAR